MDLSIVKFVCSNSHQISEEVCYSNYKYIDTYARILGFGVPVIVGFAAGFSAMNACFRIFQRIKHSLHQEYIPPHIQELENRIKEHTQDLSDDNPIKPMLQKYITAKKVQRIWNYARSWIFFWRR